MTTVTSLLFSGTSTAHEAVFLVEEELTAPELLQQAQELQRVKRKVEDLPSDFPALVNQLDIEIQSLMATWLDRQGGEANLRGDHWREQSDLRLVAAAYVEAEPLNR